MAKVHKPLVKHIVTNKNELVIPIQQDEYVLFPLQYIKDVATIMSYILMNIDKIKETKIIITAEDFKHIFNCDFNYRLYNVMFRKEFMNIQYIKIINKEEYYVNLIYSIKVDKEKLEININEEGLNMLKYIVDKYSYTIFKNLMTLPNRISSALYFKLKDETFIQLSIDEITNIVVYGTDEDIDNDKVSNFVKNTRLTNTIKKAIKAINIMTDLDVTLNVKDFIYSFNIQKKTI